MNFTRPAILYTALTLGIVAAFILYLNSDNPTVQGFEEFISKSVSSITEITAIAEDLPETTVIKETPVEGVADQNVTSAAVIPQASPSIEDSKMSDLIDKIPLEYADQVFSTDDIADDKLNFVSQDFKVPEGLKKRVGFWLNIYTKYSSHFSLVHDSREPWIVYKVVDLRPIYESSANRFVKATTDHNTIIKARNEVRAHLMKLARKQSYTNLSADEYDLYKLLENKKGSRRHVFLEAARNVRLQRGQKDFFRGGVVSISRYISEMEDIFARSDLPVELVRLPLVESSFNLDATSKVGASGVWQFMLGMGKKYLKVSSSVDERNSPIKATEAASKLMLSNFKVTPSWPLAITAYNHGAGGVEKACKRLHTTNISDLVNNYHSRSFSFASQNFYSEFLAALYGEKYQDKVFGVMPKYPPLQAEEVDLKHSIRARKLVGMVGMTIEELKLYNPDLKSQAIAGSTFLPVGYHVRLPVGHKLPLETYNQQVTNHRKFSSKI